MSATPYTTTSTSANFSVPGPVDIAISSSDYLGFFGTTPVAKQGGSALATLTFTTITATGGYGFVSAAEGNALAAQVKALTAALAAYGIIKQA